MASDREQQQAPTFYRNPGQGTVLNVAAGGQLDAEFDFLNDSPDVAMFCLESDGLPDRRWILGTGTQNEVAAAAAGGGTLRISLQPAVDAAPGNYPFGLRILSANSVIGPQLNLVLSVGPPVRRGPGTGAPVQQSPSAAPVAPRPVPPTPPVPAGQTNFVPDPNRTWIAAEDPGWNNPNNPAWKAAKVPEAPQKPSWSPPPSAAAPQPPAWNAPTARPNPAPANPTPPAARPAPPAWSQPAPPPTARPAFQAPTPPQPQVPAAPAPAARPAAPSSPPWNPAPPAATPPAASTPPWNPVPAPAPSTTNWNNGQAATSDGEEELHIVDLAPPPVQEEVQEEAKTPVAPTEKSIISPRNGEAFPVRPGDTLLVRFPFVNTTPATTTYVLDEDRSLPQGWITLVQDQVNLIKNGEGEVSFRLSPSLTAEAGEYPFTVSVGPQGGQITQYALILQVPVVPGVLLTAKSFAASLNPFTTAADLHFSAEINGNADTAFRVSVKSHEDGQEDRDIYETPNWRYIFDKELETLEAPTAHRASTPVPLRLRVERRGTWWFGFKESHKIRVAAVPVTEPTNGGKPGNTLDLTVSRWRILPIPVALFLPILLCLLILGSGGAKTFDASNAFLDDQGHYWAVLPIGEQKNVGLTWTADRLSLLKFTALQGSITEKTRTTFGSGSVTDTVDLSNEIRKVDRSYSVARIMGGGDQQLSVSYIYTANDTPMQVIDETVPSHNVYESGDDVYIPVPATGFARIILRNASQQFSRIDWWLADGLDSDDPYKFLYDKNEGSIQPGGVETLLVERNNDNALTPDTRIVIVSTDATRPIMTIHFTCQ